MTTSLACVLHPALRLRSQEPGQEPRAQEQQPAPAPGEAPVEQEPAFLTRQEAGEGAAEQEVPPPPAGPRAPQACGTETMLMVIAMVAIFYFLLIRPQQKQEKARKAMLAAIKVGDDVVTTGGIHGTISSMTGETVVLRVDPKVKITVDRGHIARLQGGEPTAGAAAPK